MLKVAQRSLTMITKYCFFDGGELEFDNTKSVRELIEYAFEVFDYYEPLGMNIVTIFQAHHSKSSEGWFTTDTSRSCAEEIENCDELCFAYYLPDVFYFAEGGWGHHMKTLGNHPLIDDPVSLHLRFDEFDNTVVINGKYSFEDIINYLQEGDYLPDNVKTLLVRAINPYKEPYLIPLSDESIKLNLRVFEKILPNSVNIIEII